MSAQTLWVWFTNAGEALPRTLSDTAAGADTALQFGGLSPDMAARAGFYRAEVELRRADAPSYEAERAEQLRRGLIRAIDLLKCGGQYVTEAQLLGLEALL
jgi:hypothetical protein